MSEKRSLIYADEDGPGWKTVRRRRERDLAFLEELRAKRDAGDTAWLYLEWEKYESKSAPRWKRVAIDRAITAVRIAFALEEWGEAISARTRQR